MGLSFPSNRGASRGFRPDGRFLPNRSPTRPGGVQREQPGPVEGFLDGISPLDLLLPPWVRLLAPAADELLDTMGQPRPSEPANVSPGELPGWTVFCEVATHAGCLRSDREIVTRWMNFPGFAMGCTCLGFTPWNSTTTPQPIASTDRIAWQVGEVSGQRVSTRKVWTRPVPAPAGAPPMPTQYGELLPGAPRSFQSPQVAPQWMPAVDPLSVPIFSPPFVPMPLPFRLIPLVRTNPSRSPSEQTQKGNRLPPLPGPNTRPAEETITERDVEPQTQTLPRMRLSIIIDQRLGVIPPAKGNSRPGNEKTKEAKLILAPHRRSLVAWLMNAATESNDFLAAIHKALPEECQGKRTNPVGKARDIYNCFSEIDWNKAVCNLVKNEVEDNIYGRGGRGWAKVNRKINHPSGSPRRADQPRFSEEVGQPTDVLDAACDAYLGSH